MLRVNILSALLLFSTFGVYAQENADLIELKTGKPKVYNSKDDGKMLSDSFTIAYPASWDLKDPAATLVKRFFKSIDNSVVAYVVVVKKHSPAFTDKELETELEWMPASIPRQYHFISNNPKKKLGTMKAGVTEYYNDDSVDGRDVRVYFYTFSTFSKNSFIQVQFSVGSDRSDKNLKNLFESYKPFFEAVANTFVVLN